MSREITKLQFLVLYVAFGILIMAFKEMAHRNLVVLKVSPTWMGLPILVVLFVLFLPWFLKLPSGGRK